MKRMNFWLSLLLMGGMTTFISCSDDDGGGGSTPNLEIESIKANGTDLESGENKESDLNGATAAGDVPLDGTITIVFSKEADASTATASNINLTSGSTTVDATVNANGSSVTLNPTEELERGTDYTLNISGGLKAEDGGSFPAITRTFTTAGRAEVVPPQSDNQVAYWRFDGDATDELGNYDADAEIAVEYQEDRFGEQSSTAYFDGDVSIIEVNDAGSLMTDAESFTLSFWVKTDSEGHINQTGDPTGMFVFGLGAFHGIQYEIYGSYDGSKFASSYINAEGEEVSEDMWLPNGATDNTTGGWQGWDYARNLTAEQMTSLLKDTWLHAIFTYDATEKRASLYYNGQLMKSFDFDLWPDGDVKRSVVGVTYKGTEPEVYDDFTFGFVHSREGTLWDSEPWGGYDFPTAQHFKGWLDDFRIFHAPFSAEDASALYDAEKP